MILRIKNKTFLALSDLVERAKTRGAIPDYIEITVKEAEGLIAETRTLMWERSNETSINRLTIGYVDTNVGQDAQMPLSKKLATVTNDNVFIKEWKEEKHNIYYSSIKFNIIGNKLVPEPVMPSNISSSEFEIDKK